MAAKKRTTAKAGRRPPTSAVPAAKRTTKKKAKAASRKASAGAPTKVGRTGSIAAKKAKKKAAAKARAAAVAPVEAVPTATLREGDRAPSFALPDQTGNTVASASLAGHPYVLYFYPKDDTPGCTTEACGFRDASPEFDGVGVRVLGVSPDSVASHEKFAGKYGLPFTLLSDTGRELASAYGVWTLKKLYGRESMGIVRSTFLVDGDGVIRKAWRGVRVNGHVPEVQAAAAQLA